MKARTNKKVKNRQDSQESTISTQTSLSIREFELFQQFCSLDAEPSHENLARGWLGDFSQKHGEGSETDGSPPLNEFSPHPHPPHDTYKHDQQSGRKYFSKTWLGAHFFPHSKSTQSPTLAEVAAERKTKGKTIICTVLMLDNEDLRFELDKNSTGRDLLEIIFKYLDLLETDYFSCFYRHSIDLKTWVSFDKKLSKQVENKHFYFEFGVKFYPPDPLSLQENITRYLLCLQIQKDIFFARLPCSFFTLALLGSYIVQSQLGDFAPEAHGPDSSYLEHFSFSVNQNQELLDKISELHKTHGGLTSTCASDYFLLNASKIALYGVHLQEAKDGRGKTVEVGINSTSLVIYQDGIRLNRFVWPKMLKLSYRGTKFVIDIRTTLAEETESSFKYKMSNYKIARNFWQLAVEHHSFFRMKEMIPEKKRLSLLNIGHGRFRFEGRTHHESLQASSLITRPPSEFVRIKYNNSVSQSKSFHSSADQILNNSAHFVSGFLSQHDIFSQTSFSSMSPPPCHIEMSQTSSITSRAADRQACVYSAAKVTASQLHPSDLQETPM